MNAEQEGLFVESVLMRVQGAFYKAYWSRFAGESETGILIDFDIETASRLDADKDFSKTLRKTIISACRAVEEQVDYDTAVGYLMTSLRDELNALLNKERKRCDKYALAKD